MDITDPNLKAYLSQLNDMTGGDPDAQVSMHDVGQVLGIEKDEAGQMAEALFIGGHAELKTLSGGIGITAMGLKALGIAPASPSGGILALSREKVMTETDIEVLDILLREIKSGVGDGKTDYSVLETIVTDIKTIEVQMLSPAPKTAVVRELIKSVIDTLPEEAFSDLRNQLKSAVEN